MVCINFIRETQYMGIFLFLFFCLYVYTLAAAHRIILVNTENDTALIWMGSNMSQSTSNTVRSANEGNGDRAASLPPRWILQ